MIGQDIPRNNPMPLRIAYRRVLWIFTYGLFTNSLRSPLCGLASSLEWKLWRKVYTCSSSE